MVETEYVETIYQFCWESLCVICPRLCYSAIFYCNSIYVKDLDSYTTSCRLVIIMLFDIFSLLAFLVNFCRDLLI